VPIRGVGELEPEDQRIFFGLLETVARILVRRLSLDYGDGKDPPVAQEVIGALLRPAQGASARYDNAPVGECPLFIDLVVCPCGGIELWQDIFSTGICLIHREFLGKTLHAGTRIPGNSANAVLAFWESLSY
jgi:hypothetical protein